MDEHEAEKCEAVFGEHHAQKYESIMTRKQRRLTMIGGSLAAAALAAALVLNAMRDSIVFFSTPDMVAEKHIPPGKRFRLGGLVEKGSLGRGDNLAVSFKVSDGNATPLVTHQGIFPDLF